MSRRELSVLRDPALLHRALEDAFAVFIPAIVKLALILVGPFLHDVVRAVDGAARPIHEERLIRLKSFVFVQPADGVVGQVFAQVVALFGRPGRQNLSRIPHQVRLVMRGLARKKAVEVFESQSRRPVLEWAGDGRLLGRSIVPLAPGARAVAVVLEHLGDEGATPRYAARVAVPVVCHLRNLTVADPVMIAARQQRRPRRRTHRRGVKPIVRNTVTANSVHRRGVDLAAEGGGQCGPGVINEHDENIRRVVGQAARLDPPFVDRLLHCPPRNARRWGWREGQYVTRVC